MKIKFKVQQYQTDAVKSVVEIFSGQPYIDRIKYRRDLGIKPQQKQLTLDGELEDNNEDSSAGFKNADLALADEKLLLSIRNMQAQNNIKLSESLIKHLGKCSLDVEMETGTGKTYVYIKTIFELQKKYGWSKFIIVVPSIAIREGVKKSFEMTQDHFMEHYGKKARYFVYNSKNLDELDNFSSSAGINVMIINIQAFNTTMKEGGRSKEARRIYEKLDVFGSRRPIDVIKANRPILILDEPQKMGGEKTQNALANFNPLFCLNYSATHAHQHNLVYVLDAVDAYNKRLVKKIEVKGFEVKNLRGTDRYLYLENIIISPTKPPMARIELERSYQKSIKRETRMLAIDDNLYSISNEMEQYKGYHISDIDPIQGTVIFTNGQVLSRGEVIGDVSESDMRRIQIRETIISHFEKEKQLFELGIKTLSLFFIDEVAKYRKYNDDGDEINSEYGEMFEQEYINILNDYITLEDTPYVKYLQNIEPSKTHTGYFSIDKKGRMIDSTTKRGSDESDDISAYDLILKNKERLLSFEEPVRFIFSHSALREGWDNPNVFQICTLKHGGISPTQKRQEVGRGLRLSVNKHGERMDVERCGSSVHDINMLTVIASEGYRNFVSDLQVGIKEALYDRPSKATQEYFTGKTVIVEGQPVILDVTNAKSIYRYLIKNDYIDDHDNVTESYRVDLENNCLAPVPDLLRPMVEGVHMLIQSVFDESVLDDMIDDGNQTKIQDNPLNDNFYKKEFQTLWNYINHQYAYSVEFDSEELIKKSIKHLNENLRVSQLKYTVTSGNQIVDLDEHSIARKDSFVEENTRTETLKYAETSQIKYDLVGKIAESTTLTRKTIVAILTGIENYVFAMFKHNPEEFITRAIRLIKEQKATMIVEHISYDQIERQYDSSIFTAGKGTVEIKKAFKANKHVQDYVVTDGLAAKSVERRFAEDMDRADEVCVYAKLPRGFSIPTPVGNYSPDWAIAFNEGTVKHIFFIAETKGSMESMDIRPIEKAKIACAKKLFNEISTSNVKYHDVDSYQTMLDVISGL
ncbi:restriction endonuclease subunit R [Anaerobacillus arseniciselenatis]|uniref:Restriction endonuclease subunit R n=1 Tax=Anaerobacillus arseniciselenatis TaxID=85682 RepID=A0A1S2LR65_9BACI|nr:DEAD/DEAH box helicase family protein [Anaerobacillus arseniciselenatis]OIJ14886.1 restriction endonuclease subunit R [Anaerobacillus arseniciselenatis]